MAVFVLPTDSTAPYYEFTVPLDNVLYRFRFKFNARDSYWYFDLFNGLSGALLRAGIKIVTGWPLLRLFQGEGRPAGNIIAVSQGDPSLEATEIAMLGTDVLLCYVGDS